jgi:hypothetical protein
MGLVKTDILEECNLGTFKKSVKEVVTSREALRETKEEECRDCVCYKTWSGSSGTKALA